MIAETGSVETGMNRFNLHPIQENRPIHERSTPLGLSKPRFRGSFFELVPDPPRGRPIGGGGIHRNLWKRGKNPGIISDYYEIHGKCSIAS